MTSDTGFRAGPVGADASAPAAPPPAPAAPPPPAADSGQPRRSGGRRRLPRWCKGTWLAVGASTAWVAFLGLHHLLSGRWWVWELVELLPPLLFAVVPLAILAAPAVLRLVRVRLPKPATWWLVVAAVVALGLSTGMTGLNLHALRPAGGDAIPADALRVVSWNAEHWHQHQDADRFYAYLTGMDADVYLIQEYLYRGEEAPYKYDDTERLREEFPDYDLAVFGEFLTLSRYPIVSATPVTIPQRRAYQGSAWSDYWLVKAFRTDVRVGTQTVSFYNVHLPTPVQFRYDPLSADFYRYTRDSRGWRQAAFDVLSADLAGNCHPILVAGDFNATGVARGVGRLDPRLRDALPANRELYPGTFALREVDWQLWRLDYAYTTADLRVHRYEFRDHEGLSDHDAQWLVVSLDPERSPATGCAAEGR